MQYEFYKMRVCALPRDILEPAWHDWIVKREDQLDAFRRYIRENPARASRRDRPTRPTSRPQPNHDSPATLGQKCVHFLDNTEKAGTVPALTQTFATFANFA